MLVTADYGLRAKSDASVGSRKPPAAPSTNNTTNLLLQLTLLCSQLHVCRYEEACSMWPDLLQPTSDRIDDDEDVDVAAVTVAASARAGACVRQELRCFACGQVSRQAISVF